MGPASIRRTCLVAATLLVLAAWGAQAQVAPGSLEYAIKATYLYKLAPFVSWRGGIPGPPTAPFQICVAGEDPFGPVLEQAVANQRVGRRPVNVRRLAAATRGAGCHVLYLGGSPAQTPQEGLDAIRGEPVLTVTDAARGAGARGMIHFWVSSGRVRFEIDQTAAALAGLSISSKLLALGAKAPGARS